jgi:catechol 2,3-dioxygenase-like lactoylglutathione lyase family enzyme
MSNTFGGAVPIFRVASVPASIEYYVSALGFKLDWGESGFVSVSRGRCHIFLCENDQGHPGTWTWIGVSDADALAADFRERGVRIRHPPTN